MSHKLVIVETAEIELDEIYRYLLARSPQGAATWYRSFLAVSVHGPDGDWSIFRRFQPSITLESVRKHGPIPFSFRPVNGYSWPVPKESPSVHLRVRLPRKVRSLISSCATCSSRRNTAILTAAFSRSEATKFASYVCGGLANPR